jgi:magnesium chelatase family protein
MCGHLGDPRHACRCTPHQILQYRARISGPLLDRIDLHVEVAPVPYRALGADAASEPSAAPAPASSPPASAGASAWRSPVSPP